jgi:general stress protein 26
VDDLQQWFEHGAERPGTALLCVKAKQAKYWQDTEMGEWKA